MIEIHHLSYSSLSAYQQCPRAWRFKYIESRPTKTTPELAYGTAWHNTVEQVIHRSAAGFGSDLAGIWQEQFKIAFSAVDENPNDLKDSHESLYQTGLERIQASEVVDTIGNIRPINVDGSVWIEQKIELLVPGVSVPIIGYIDCIGTDGVPIDFKTASRAWPVDRAQEELQPLFYLAALNQRGLDRWNPEYKFRHIVFPKTGKKLVQIFETKHSMKEIFWLFGAIRDMWHGIVAQSFPPITGTWKCSADYCDFWSGCRGLR